MHEDPSVQAESEASTAPPPVSFIPVNALQGETAKRASTIHSVQASSDIYIKREPITGPVSFIPVSALTGAQRAAKRQEASTIPPAGSAPGTVPATVTYPAGQTDGPMMYMFAEDGSVVAMPVPSGTV